MVLGNVDKHHLFTKVNLIGVNAQVNVLEMFLVRVLHHKYFLFIKCKIVAIQMPQLFVAFCITINWSWLS